MHDLPSKSNVYMLNECKDLSPWNDVCKFMVNVRLGPPLENVDGVLFDTGWYGTNQFAMEVIFRNRMKRYKCLTNDFSLSYCHFFDILYKS